MITDERLREIIRHYENPDGVSVPAEGMIFQDAGSMAAELLALRKVAVEARDDHRFYTSGRLTHVVEKCRMCTALTEWRGPQKKEQG